jgi:hypothetical protein
MGWLIGIILIILIAYTAYRWSNDAEPTPIPPDPEKAEEPPPPPPLVARIPLVKHLVKKKNHRRSK